MAAAFNMDKAISIHAAREGGDFYSSSTFDIYRISIHAAREGGDARFGMNP